MEAKPPQSRTDNRFSIRNSAGATLGKLVCREINGDNQAGKRPLLLGEVQATWRETTTGLGVK